jgi:hypothetical protein
MWKKDAAKCGHCGLKPNRRIQRVLAAGFVAGLLGAAAVVSAQPFGGFGFRMPPRYADKDSFDGGFNFCRLAYTSVRREESGMGWWTDYPRADQNFMVRFSELTKATVSKDKTGEPMFLVVRTTDEALFRCPFIHVEDAGTAGFTEEEVERLRAYLVKGGFIWSDDYWGTPAWEHWVEQIGRVLPPEEYPIFDIPSAHPIFRTMFDVKRVPQIAHIQFWRRSGGATSERGLDSNQVHFRGIQDAQGRLMVLMSHNTDIADGWEREGDDPRFFEHFSIESYALGINVLIYVMTH